ncbi:hypothetical protein JEQ12_000493 [Ovis aries]|uniref:Uncharacterized protein n=1 Tax=Ovis aries TaxID=9940 RepID=A0A836ANU0_SHEEP|nr:hypothetical protein JEQ12_000493 [Ovis aries]
MTSVRLPSSTLRKSDAWIGLCRAQRGTPSLKGCVFWNQYLYLSSANLLKASNYKTLLHSIFSVRLPGLLISPEYILPFFHKTQKYHNDMNELEEEPRDHPSEVKSCKDLGKVVQSLQFDVKVGDTLNLLIGEDKEVETEEEMWILLKKVLKKSSREVQSGVMTVEKVTTA